jgi:hypothetical protein
MGVGWALGSTVKSKAKSSMHANSAVNVMKNMSKRKKAASTPVAHAEIVSLCKLLATDPNMVQVSFDARALERRVANRANRDFGWER